MFTKKHKRLSKLILCFFVSLSFFATLLPIASAANDTMPCCVGKEPGHCDSGIGAEAIPPPPPEPMCGLDNITIVAKPSHRKFETTSHAAESKSVSKPCQMECGACASASSRQQKRERGVVEAGHQALTSTSTSRVENLPLGFTSNEHWPRINPRGPPCEESSKS